MPTIAPWLVPPDYIGAMSRGAGLGLQARAQDIGEEEYAQRQAEAGDRLRLAYATLASQEKRADTAAQARLQQAQAGLALRGALAAQTMQFRQHNLEQQAKHQAEMQDLNLKRIQETIAHNTAMEGAKVDPDERSLMAEYAKAQGVADAARIKAAKYTATKPEVSTSRSLLHPFTPVTTTNQVPVLSESEMEKAPAAKADLEEAQNVLNEKRLALENYRKGAVAKLAEKKESKYQIGKIYGKKNPMKYLGGDPYDESSWEPAEQ